MEKEMSQMNKLDARQQLLVVTMEECGELVQACSKILRRQELYGDSKYINNLKEEIGDVYCMIKLMQEWDVVSWDELEERDKVKRAKLSKWSNLISEKV
jgi:NTP pyrophosphatase (non-canonical NTP hydrolase)